MLRSNVATLAVLLFFGAPLIFADEPAALAQELLERAHALDTGLGGKRDLPAAVALYEQAAAAGDAHAHLRLGHFHEVGDGVPQDHVAARKHYQTAVDLGLTAARVPLAICHLEGWGGSVSRDDFVREIRTAAEAGDNAARKILGSAYAAGIGVPRDQTQAFHWFRQAAEADDAEAQHMIGRATEGAQRFVTKSNAAIARTWYQLSAEQEYTTAMRAMARSFLRASGAEADWDKFREWLDLATESGDDEAPFMLAVTEMLRPGAFARDEKKAREWIDLAARRGNYNATETLDFIETGWTLERTLRYLLTQSQEDRYVQRARRAAGDGPTRAPVPTKTVIPVYPLTFRAAGITGSVTVDFVVDTTGRVEDAVAIESSHPAFSERALAAIREWRFEPGLKENRRVNTRVQLVFPFNLREETMDGIDGLLRTAWSRAQALGPEFERDATGLRIARPKSKLQFPAQGQSTPNERRYALVILVLDDTGRPIRGRILDAVPAELGEECLQIGLGSLFEPRLEEGKPVPSNVLLSFDSEIARDPHKP